MRQLVKLFKMVFLLPLYVYRTHQRLEELKMTVWRFKRLVELSLQEIPAVIPIGFRPLHPCNLRRVGGDSDGGYLVTEEALRSTEVLISYGIDFDWEFERLFSEASGARVFAYDRSTVDRLAETDEAGRLRFHRFFDGKRATFHSAFIGDGEHGTVRVAATLRGHEGKRVFIKFDIEGAEYEPAVFEDLLNLPRNVIGVVAEFHGFPVNAERIRELVTSNGFHIVHIHVNNAGGVSEDMLPNLVELTLLRDGYFRRSDEIHTYPLGIDRPCIASKRDMRLHFEGWSSR